MHFLTKNGHFAFLSTPLGGLGATNFHISGDVPQTIFCKDRQDSECLTTLSLTVFTQRNKVPFMWYKNFCSRLFRFLTMHTFDRQKCIHMRIHSQLQVKTDKLCICINRSKNDHYYYWLLLLIILQIILISTKAECEQQIHCWHTMTPALRINHVTSLSQVPCHATQSLSTIKWSVKGNELPRSLASITLCSRGLLYCTWVLVASSVRWSVYESDPPGSVYMPPSWL